MVANTLRRDNSDPASYAGRQQKRDPLPPGLATEGERISKRELSMSLPSNGAGVQTPTPPIRAAGGPNWLPIIPDAIPRELADTRAWYLAVLTPKASQVGKWDKIPSDPATGKRAKWSDPSTRSTFGNAFMGYEAQRGQGVGFMLDESFGLVGIDLDGCVAPDGTIAPWALEIVASFAGAYWEHSISGTGLRGFCRGSLPVGGCRSKIEGCSVELYADQRFLVVTGQALHHAEQLPELQSAVDALHKRLTAGRTSVTGVAATSGLTGRNADPSPQVFELVQAVMAGRHGAQMLAIWSREDLHVAGASEDDWALATEAAYQAISRGYDGDELHQLVESTMRAGPYREKWDTKRGQVSWLTQTVANAIATVRKRLSDRPAARLHVVTDHEPADAEPIPEESPEQRITRLERELAEARGVMAVQRSALQAARAELEDKTAFLSHVTSVLAKPNDEMSSTEKVVALALAYEVHYRADRGRTKLPLIALVERTGLSKNTVSTASRALTDREGSPFERRVTRELIHDQDGAPQWVTTVEFRPRTKRTEDTLRAVATLPAAPQRTKHGGSQQATEARWRRCPEHQDDDVLVKGVCSSCGKVVGERRMTAQEWQVLNHQDCDSDGGAFTVSVPVLSTPQLWDSDGQPTVNHQDAVSAAPILARLPDWGPAPQLQIVRPAWRCQCGSYERYPRPDGGWRCDGCGRLGAASMMIGGAG